MTDRIIEDRAASFHQGVTILPQRVTVPEHLALDDQRGVADHRLKPQRATPAEATTQSGSLAVPAQGTCSVDFRALPHFKFAAPAIYSVQPVERRCHSQPKERT